MPLEPLSVRLDAEVVEDSEVDERLEQLLLYLIDAGVVLHLAQPL